MGETVRIGTPQPVPESGTDRVDAGALPLIAKLALRVATAVGSKVTEMVQVPPNGAMELPQLLDAIAKSPGFEPPSATEEMAKAPVPEFVSVTVLAALVVLTD